MSKHVCTLQAKSAGMVRVEIGYDRPLNGYYMNVTDGGGADEGFIYDSMTDAALLESGGLASDLSHFSGVLARLQVDLPAVILNQVRLDGERGTSSRIAIYDGSGQLIGGA